MALGANLISSWKLDESSGTRVDNFGSNDLTDNNTVTSETGKVYDTAATFVAANSEYLSITDASQVGLTPGTSDWSVEVWIKGDAESSGSNPIIVCHAGVIGGGNPSGWIVGLTGSDRLVAHYHMSSVRSIFGNDTGTVLTLNGATWHHCVVVWDRNDKMYRYVDGVNTGDNITISTGVSDNLDPSNNFQIGARDYVSDPLPFDGAIGPARFWKRALSSTEVTKLYNSGAGLTDRQLLYTPKTIMY